MLGNVSIWVGYASARGAVSVSTKFSLKVVAVAPVYQAFVPRYVLFPYHISVI